MKFLDLVKVYIQSGDGGAGCVSFRREKCVEFGGPDGGNGGRGGDIIIKAISDLNTLIDFRYQQHFKVARGQHGMGRNRTGRSSDNIVLKVPVGTQVFDEEKEILLADLTEEGQEVILAKGGDGGFGNTRYKGPVQQAPRKSTPGWPGESRWVWLQMKLIADVGLVGLPNAGKSTFLSATTRAKPKIASYPFTTLHPQLGVVAVQDQEFVLADIPGLIEGAHEGTGLGDRFLGHIERCRVLLHLVDTMQEDIVAAYHTIRTELRSYGHGLAEKTEMVALNKCDLLPEEEQAEKVKALSKAIERPVFLVSGATQAGLSAILAALLTVLQTKNKEEDGESRPFEDRLLGK